MKKIIPSPALDYRKQVTIYKQAFQIITERPVGLKNKRILYALL